MFVQVLLQPVLDVVGEVVETPAVATGAEENAPRHRSAHDPTGRGQLLTPGPPLDVAARNILPQHRPDCTSN